MRLVRGVLRAAAVVVPVAVGLAAVLRGGRGAASAAVALGLVLANVTAAGAILAIAFRWKSVLAPSVAMPSYAFRMGALLAVLAWLRSATFIDPPTFAVAFGAGVLGTLGVEWRIWARTPWLALVFSEQRSPR